MLDKKSTQAFIPYLATGVGIFGGVGSPEGVQVGGIGSQYTDLAAANIYVKTTAFDILTGWVLLGGGGGSGTVTSFSAGNLSPLFNSSVATPTTTPALTFAQINQNANLVFAGPNTGIAAAPTFRALVVADLPAGTLADPPTNSIQFNNGSNLFQGEPELTYDPLTATLLLGASGGLSGQQDFRNTNGNRIRFRTNNPVNSDAILWDSLPTLNQVLTAIAVSGSNITLGWSTPSGGGVTANPTVGVLPYLSAANVYSDSQLSRVAGGIVLTGTGSQLFAAGANGATNPVFAIDASTGSVITGLQVKGLVSGSGVNLSALGGTNEPINLIPKGSGNIVFGDGSQASLNIASNLSGANDALITFGNASINFDPANAGFTQRFSNAAIITGSSIQIGWGAGSSSQTANDTGLVRNGVAGIVRTTNGSTGIGQLQVAAGSITQQGNLHVEPSSSTLPAIWMSLPSNTATVNPVLAFRRSQGTNASPTAVANSYILGTVRWNGQFNTSDANFTQGAEIRATAKETWSVSQNGAQMEFFTAPLGGGGIAQVGKWHANGVWCVGADPTSVNAVNKQVVGNSIGFNSDVVSCIAAQSADTASTVQDLQLGGSSVGYYQRYYELGDGTPRARVNINGQHEEQVGRSGTYARTPGNWLSNITPTGNLSTGETTLHSYTINANSLRTDKDRLDITGSGRTASNTNAKELRFKFGATTFGDTTSVIVNGAPFTFTASIIRTGATTQLCFITLNSAIAGVLSLFNISNSTTAAETLSSNVTLAITGQGGASNDIILDYSQVTYNPATI